MQNHIGAQKGLSLSDPRVRAWLFQILTIVFVVGLGWYLFHNTQTNLQHRGITSGFDFLDRSAGFGIAQHLIPYVESDSYARVFVIGLLNTLLVTFIGVILATILGFIIGVARLSPNWMINKLATMYVETFRNIPPLLQILFWYFAVFLTLPGPRGSINIDDMFFISNRGLNMPGASMADGFWPFIIALVVAIVAIGVMVHLANKRFDETGVPFHKFWVGLALLLVIPGLSVLLFGSPVSWEVPQLKGFNFVGGWVLIPELLALTSRAFRLYALSFVIMGFNVYASSFFTALGDGVTSALISFLRTLVFQIAAVLILPAILGIDGIWLAVTAAELAALAVSAAMFVTKDKVFHYRKA